MIYHSCFVTFCSWCKDKVTFRNMQEKFYFFAIFSIYFIKNSMKRYWRLTLPALSHLYSAAEQCIVSVIYTVLLPYY